MTLLPEAKRLSWPRYLYARTYRNPYVKAKKKSHKPQPRCIDCATLIKNSGSRCRRCYGISQRGMRPNNTTTPRVLAAVKSGKFTTQTCVATEVGVSRERVRQILNASGDTEFGHRILRFEWLCPECEIPISLTRYQLARLVHMPAHCRPCAKKYCWKGEHLLSEHANKNGACKPCGNAYRREIVEVRTCAECGKDLEISRGALGQIKYNQAAGKYHKKCYAEILGRFHIARRENENRLRNKHVSKEASIPLH